MYVIVLIILSAIIGCLGVLIRKGHLNLLHDYHVNEIPVRNRAEYGVAMGNSIIFMACMILTSSVIGIFVKNVIPGLVLMVGIVISVIALIITQNKYREK